MDHVVHLIHRLRAWVFYAFELSLQYNWLLFLVRQFMNFDYPLALIPDRGVSSPAALMVGLGYL